MSALSVPEDLAENFGEKTKRRNENRYGSGAEKTQRSPQRKGPSPSPLSLASLCDQTDVSYVGKSADQTDIMTHTKEKTSSAYVGCAGDVTTEYTLRSVRMALTRREPQGGQ